MTATTLRRLQPKAAVAADPAAVASSRWSNGWIYFCVVMTAWCFVPLMRRLLDWHNGFYNPIQITSTIPYVVTLPLAFFCFRPERVARMTPVFKVFAWVWLAVMLYALVIAIFAGNLNAGLYEAVQYLVPMLVGIWLAGDEIENPRLMGRLSVVILAFGGIVAVYGLAQFVSPPPWDALWLEGGNFQSMGVAAPFSMRIFSTLNSTGPAADFFVAAIIFALPFFEFKRVWIWPFVGAVGGALLLTLVRASWIGLLVGGTVYLIMSPRRFRALPFIAIYSVLLIFFVATLPGLLGAGGNSDVVTSRIASLGDVGHDDSALARTGEIADAFQAGLQNPIGMGLGQIGSSSALSANPETAQGNNLDSGYMARFLELGWVGFAGYLFVVLGSLVMMIGAAFRRHTDQRKELHEAMATIVATAVALCAALVWADAAGDSHLGIDGLLFWIAMGIGFRRIPPEHSLARIATLRATVGTAARKLTAGTAR